MKTSEKLDLILEIIEEIQRDLELEEQGYEDLDFNK